MTAQASAYTACTAVRFSPTGLRRRRPSTVPLTASGGTP